LVTSAGKRSLSDKQIEGATEAEAEPFDGEDVPHAIPAICNTRPAVTIRKARI
jgi:hypothetical protein